MTSKSPVRSCEDIDEAALSYAEVKALATGNPYIKEKMDLDIQVSKLKLLKANHTSQRYRLEDNIAKHYPQQIATMQERIAGYQADLQTYKNHKSMDKDDFSMQIGNRIYTDKKEAGVALIEMCRSAKQPDTEVAIGEYQGFQMKASYDTFFSRFSINLKGQLSHVVEIGADPLGNLQRLSNVLENMAGKKADIEQKLSNVEHQLETAKIEVEKPFAQEKELEQKQERLSELNALLNMDEKGGSEPLLDEIEDQPDIANSNDQLGKERDEDYSELSNEELIEKIHGMENEKGIHLGRAVNSCCDRKEMRTLLECLNCEESVLDEYLNMIQPIYPTIYKNAVAKPGWKSSAERLQVFGAARHLIDQSSIEADKILENDRVVETVRLPGC